MKKPKNPILIPRGGYQVKFPETGYEVVENHPSAFLQKCRQHMDANGIDYGGDWRDKLFHMSCDQHPDMDCIDSENPEVSITSEDIRRFLLVLIKSRESGATAVSDEEQDRRAEICLACPKSGYVSCFGFCGWISEVLSQFTLGRKIKKLPQLHKLSCTACKCELSSKTSFPLDVLQAIDEKMGKPDYHPSCWMND